MNTKKSSVEAETSILRKKNQKKHRAEALRSQEAASRRSRESRAEEELEGGTHDPAQCWEQGLRWRQAHQGGQRRERGGPHSPPPPPWPPLRPGLCSPSSARGREALSGRECERRAWGVFEAGVGGLGSLRVCMARVFVLKREKGRVLKL